MYFHPVKSIDMNQMLSNNFYRTSSGPLKNKVKYNQIEWILKGRKERLKRKVYLNIQNLNNSIVLIQLFPTPDLLD